MSWTVFSVIVAFWLIIIGLCSVFAVVLLLASYSVQDHLRDELKAIHQTLSRREPQQTTLPRVDDRRPLI